MCNYCALLNGMNTSQKCSRRTLVPRIQLKIVGGDEEIILKGECRGFVSGFVIKNILGFLWLTVPGCSPSLHGDHRQEPKQLLMSPPQARAESSELIHPPFNLPKVPGH